MRAFVLSCLVASVAAASPIVEKTLANGMRVVIAPDPSVTSVVVHVRYHVGSKDEVAGKTGFAHLFEHLMFEGSKHVPEGAFDSWLEAAGGWNNGTTDKDRTNYYEQVPSAFLSLALHLEADRMAGLWDAMNQKVLDNQRDVVKNELRQSYENRPYGKAIMRLSQLLWPVGHGNHHPTIGSMADLSAASLADVEAFWRQYYVPSNATLVIVGGVRADESLSLVERYFGWIPSVPAPATIVTNEPVKPLAKPIAETHTDNVSAPMVLLAFRGPAHGADEDAAATVMAHILGGGKTSRLYRKLVMNERLASEADASFDRQILGGEFWISAIASSGKVPSDVQAALESTIGELQATTVPAAELVRAKRTLEVELLNDMEELSQRADAYAEWKATTGRADFLQNELAALKAVTAEDVQRAAQKWLGPQRQVTLTVLPKEEGAN